MESERTKVTFVLNTDVRLGGGVEKVVLNYIGNAPRSGFDITIMQTDFFDEKRLSDSFVKKVLENVEIVSVKGYDHKFDFLRKSRIGLIFANTIIIPLVLNIAKFFPEYRKAIQKMCKSDVIYLFKNDYHVLFNKCNSILIGSNHTSLANERSIVNRLEFKLIRDGLVDRNVDGFHFFPSKKNIAHTLNKRFTLLLANGVDTASLVPREVSNRDKLRLLYVGRLEPYKGIKTLLKAWNYIEDKKGLELHVVGGGSLWQEVAKMVGNGLVYHGIVSNEELSDIYKQSDVFVYPTEWDSQPLVVLEALSSGLYVVTSENIRGTFDDFEEKKFLEYVPNDSRLIAERISKIHAKWKADDRPVRQYQYILENYSWKIVTEKLFAFFSTISKK